MELKDIATIDDAIKLAETVKARMTGEGSTKYPLEHSDAIYFVSVAFKWVSKQMELKVYEAEKDIMPASFHVVEAQCNNTREEMEEAIQGLRYYGIENI